MTNTIESMKNLVQFLWWLFLTILLLYMLGITISETVRKIKDKWK